MLKAAASPLPAARTRPGRRSCHCTVVHAATDVRGFERECFTMDSAPILIPSGNWKEVPGGVVAAQGFQASGMHSGMRSGKRADLALVACNAGAVAAGVFTKNLVCAAPVQLCKQVLSTNAQGIRAVLINAGQANAATGDQGLKDACASQEAVAQQLDCSSSDVLVMSTGVIGKKMKLDALQAGVPPLVGALGRSVEDAERAAVAITTTDLVTKSCALEVDVAGVPVRLGGMAKGSGMIHPNMATMLGLLTCDARVEAPVWQGMLSRAIKRSFNAISVDGDTSTNDTVLALASGMAGNPTIASEESEAGVQLEAALTATLQGMAKAIAWDGEGATCLLEVTCTGARDEEDALKVAKAVASSSLAKAAVFGHDPNWGRIACAAGYSGATFDQTGLGVKLGPYQLMADGQPLDFDRDAASSYLKSTTAEHGTVTMEVSLGAGAGVGRAWGCDLSYDYVRINAEYTT